MSSSKIKKFLVSFYSVSEMSV